MSEKHTCKLIIEVPSGTRVTVEPSLALDVEVTTLIEADWEFCEEHAAMHRLDGGSHELAMFIGHDETYLEDLQEYMVAYGCSDDFASLIDLARAFHATWLMLHT